MSEKLFTSAGITLHSRDSVEVNKVRFGNDHIRMIKMLTSARKIGVSYNFGGRDDGYLDPQRVDVIELPQPMTKVDAVKFLLQHPDFQSADDQALLQESLGAKEPKAPRVKKEKVVTSKAKAKMSLDTIKARGKKQVSAEQLLGELVAE
jgi:hypothetical protein